LYPQYNESVLQTLVPKTVDGLKVDLGVDVKFMGYTGKCISTADDGGIWASKVVQASGSIAPSGNPYTKIEIDCSDSEVKVRWECVSCEVTAPQVTVDLLNGDKDESGHVSSAAAIFWQLIASPAVPDEVNGVNGTLIAPVADEEQTVFRGPEANVVTVNLIPATYANSITKVQMMSFRVQHDSDLLGSFVPSSGYMGRNWRNSVKFQLAMVSDVVQLDTIIAPKQTWLDVWAIAGGLFASIGATVILLMNFAESVLACCGIMINTKVKEVKKKSGGKKKKKKGKGGKGKGGKGDKGGGGKGTNMYDADAKGKNFAKGGGEAMEAAKSGVEKKEDDKEKKEKEGDKALMSPEELKELAEKRAKGLEKGAKTAKSAREKSGVSKSKRSGKEGDGEEDEEGEDPKWENLTQRQAAKYLDRMRARGQMRKQSRMATMSFTDANGAPVYSPPGSNPTSMPNSLPTSMGGSPMSMSMPGSMPQSAGASQFSSPIFSLPGSMPGSQGGSLAGSMPGSRGGSVPASMPGSLPASMPGSRFGSVAGSRAGSVMGSLQASRAGSIQGSRAGSYAGSLQASRAGSYAGSLRGSRAGSMAGSYAGSRIGSAAGSCASSHHGSLEGSEEDEDDFDSDEDYPDGDSYAGGGSRGGIDVSIGAGSMQDSNTGSMGGRPGEFPEDDDDDLL
jgi:hypothetical protein